MSLDLVLGRTDRDWSCGRAVEVPVPERPWDRLPPSPQMAEAVRAEMAKTATAAIRLRKQGRLPDADWQGFGKLHKRWLAASDARRGHWRETDALPLWNLREACRKYAERFAALNSLNDPKNTALVPTTPSDPSESASSSPWYLLLGAAIALAGSRIFSSKQER